MSNLMKRQLPIAMMIFLSAILFAEYFLIIPDPLLAVTAEIKLYSIVVAAFAMGLGCFDLVKRHGKIILTRTTNQWLYSLWLLIIMVVFVFVGLGYGIKSDQLQFFYRNFMMAVAMSSYSLIGWFLIFGLYSGLRVKSVQSLYLLIVFCLTLIGNSPLGASLWSGFPAIRSWIESVPNTGASRGFFIAMAIGAVAIGLKTLSGKVKVGVERFQNEFIKEDFKHT